MDSTDCLGLPFPVCSPPLVKDASDIAQFRDLAFATDAAVQQLADYIDTTITGPPAVIMEGGDTSVGQVVDHFYGAVPVFDNFNMADTVADVIRIQRDGWYMFGGGVIGTLAPTSVITMRVDPLLNGEPVWTRQGDSFAASTAGLAPDAVAWVDVQFLRTGDALTFRTQHNDNPASSVSYNHTGWAILVMPSV